LPISRHVNFDFGNSSKNPDEFIVSTFSHSIDDISGTCVFNRGTNKFLICVVSGNGTNTVGVCYESSMSLYV
jgi:hypothetical protein